MAGASVRGPILNRYSGVFLNDFMILLPEGLQQGLSSVAGVFLSGGREEKRSAILCPTILLEPFGVVRRNMSFLL